MGDARGRAKCGSQGTTLESHGKSPQAGEQKKGGGGGNHCDILLMEQKLFNKYLERKIYILLTFPIFGEIPSLPPNPQTHAQSPSML